MMALDAVSKLVKERVGRHAEFLNSKFRARVWLSENVHHEYIGMTCSMSFAHNLCPDSRVWIKFAVRAVYNPEATLEFTHNLHHLKLSGITREDLYDWKRRVVSLAIEELKDLMVV